MITELEKLGLTEKEAKVYLAVLELGTDAAQNIAKKAGVNRATTYFILESLTKLGLVSSFEKDKKAFFSAEPPSYLKNLLKKKEDELTKNKKELDHLMPELEAIFNVNEKKPVVRYFEGKEGIEAINKELYEMTDRGHVIYTMTNLDDSYKAYPGEEAKRTQNRIDQERVLKQIYNSEKGPIRKTFDKEELRESRYVPRNKFPIDISLNIIPGKAVRIATYKDGFAGISIRHPKIADSLKTLFDLAWETATKYNKEAKKEE